MFRGEPYWRVVRECGGEAFPPISRGGLSFSRPASLMTPFPGRHWAFGSSSACDPEQPSFHIPARLLGLPALKEPPICWTSAAGLTLWLERDHRPARHGHNSLTTFPQPWFTLRGPEAGPGPHFGKPQGDETPSSLPRGWIRLEEEAGRRLRGAASLLLFHRRAEEEDGWTGLTGNWAKNWGGCKKKTALTTVYVFQPKIWHLW